MTEQAALRTAIEISAQQPGIVGVFGPPKGNGGVANVAWFCRGEQV
jgi:hypothetical protein